MRMGSNKQYAPNGTSSNTASNVQCTRRMVASVFNTLTNTVGGGTGGGGHYSHSTSAGGGGGHSLLSQFRSWQRAKRIRASASSMTPLDIDRDEQHSSLTPMANLCYQSMAAMFTSSKHKTTTTTTGAHCYKTTRKANISSPTSVSFHNKGDGTIAMQLSDRHLMINENQLYSMNLSGTSCVDDPKLSYYVMLEPPPSGSDSTVLSSENWYYGALSRERAIHLLRACPTGSFIVRNSATKENCFALTVRVPYDFNYTGVAHYLIVPTEDGNYKIKGFQKEFHTILSLIIHHSIMREQLPCTLRLNASCKSSELGPSYNTARLRTAKSVSGLYACNNNNNYGTHYAGAYMGKSCYDLAGFTQAGGADDAVDGAVDDLMVDVDSDPTYHKVLDNFRKAMAQCL